MILCVCSNVEELFIREFLSKNPSDNDWAEFLDEYSIGKDCGCCSAYLIFLREAIQSNKIVLD